MLLPKPPYSTKARRVCAGPSYVYQIIRSIVKTLPTLLLTALALLMLGIACSPAASSDQTSQAEAKKAAAMDTAKYKKQGMEIAMSTFKALSTQLKSALKEGGVENAAQYCNTVAYPLVDSLSEVHQATIRRTSRKIRNPKDAPIPREEAMLNTYHDQIEAGQRPAPQVRQLANGEIAFYAPIMMQELCLKCHGKLGETLKAEDYAVIQSLYPEDEAIGYSEGDLRGMWSITLPAGKQPN